MNEQIRAVVSVAEMARMVGLSRARFYQLQNEGVFPSPHYDVSTRRPFYDELLQQSCLEVRRRNCGVNGKPILFYARRPNGTGTVAKPAKPKTKREMPQHDHLLDGLKSLGLTSVTSIQVGAAVKEIYPQGTEGVDDAEVIRAVFLHLRRRDSGNSVGR
ncbi:MAG: hypothetical protein WCL32_07440 [Planctomycetota bacterium]